MTQERLKLLKDLMIINCEKDIFEILEKGQLKYT